MKNILMYFIVIAVVAVGAWLFMRKGNTTTGLYDASPSVTASVTPTATPTSTAAGSVTPTAKPGNMITTASGLQYQDTSVGTGATAKAGDTVTVKYTGTFTDGKKFDSNVDPAFGHVEPFSFRVGAGGVIKGWDEGVAGMKVGGKRKLVVPASLGYGAQDYGPIPGNSTLLFDVELVSIP
jgi:peptidylprolyl isomerase